jgi:hypothetical protein
MGFLAAPCSRSSTESSPCRCKSIYFDFICDCGYVARTVDATATELCEMSSHEIQGFRARNPRY